MEHCVFEGRASLSADREIQAGWPGSLGMLLVESGSCQVHHPDLLPLPAMTGDLLILPCPISLSPAGGCRLSGVQLGGGAPLEFAESLGGEPQLLPRGACGGAQLLIGQLADGEGRLHPAQASALAYSLLCQVAQAMEQRYNLPPLVEEALAEIREHYAEVYGVEELADTLMVNKSHLIRSFTASVGISPGRYLTLVRVENAKRLLLHPEYTLDVVASLCGFSGANYLCRVFRRETGQTPAAWRRHTASAYTPTTALEEQVFL